jgi:hypothetical protein
MSKDVAEVRFFIVVERQIACSNQPILRLIDDRQFPHQPRACPLPFQHTGKIFARFSFITRAIEHLSCHL